MIDKNWKCKRCGDCCRYVAVEDDWLIATLTEEQRQTITEEMEPVERGCKALVMRDGKATCLGQYLFGQEAKPAGCRRWSRRCGMVAKVKELIDNRSLVAHVE